MGNDGKELYYASVPSHCSHDILNLLPILDFYKLNPTVMDKPDDSRETPLRVCGDVKGKNMRHDFHIKIDSDHLEADHCLVMI